MNDEIPFRRYRVRDAMTIKALDEINKEIDRDIFRKLDAMMEAERLKKIRGCVEIGEEREIQ